MSSPTHTILLVEDDAELRDAVELLLLRKGYHVVSTGDGQRAIQLANQHRVDAALVDLLIPGQSGFQVTTDLKTIFGEDVKVAVMSGNASQAHRDYAYAAGAEQFLPKPFTVSQLFETVALLCPLPTDAPTTGHRRTVRIG